MNYRQRDPIPKVGSRFFQVGSQQIKFSSRGFIGTDKELRKSKCDSFRYEMLTQHYVEGLLNSHPQVESVHTVIAIFRPPPCTGRIIIVPLIQKLRRT